MQVEVYYLVNFKYNTALPYIFDKDLTYNQ